jgi:hypothetical protein
MVMIDHLWQWAGKLPHKRQDEGSLISGVLQNRLKKDVLSSFGPSRSQADHLHAEAAAVVVALAAFAY